jgi:hypothetical protein
MQHELETTRQELAASQRRVAELEQLLSEAHQRIQVLEHGSSVVPAPNAAPPHQPLKKKRWSIQVPEWLLSASTSAAEPHQSTCEVTQSTAEEPGWLRSASIEVLQQDAEAAAEAGSSSPYSGEAPLKISSLEQIADDTLLRATLGARVSPPLSSHGRREHEVHVTLGSHSWTVARRYSDFRRLYEDLRRLGGGSSAAARAFPVPKLLFHSEAALVQRQKRLQRFLDDALADARGSHQLLVVLEGFIGPSSAVKAPRHAGCAHETGTSDSSCEYHSVD